MGASKVPELKFQVEQDEATGMLVAKWDDPNGGGIRTEAKDLDDLRARIKEAVDAYFGKGAGTEPASAS
jgi:hypothetical protein